MKYKILTGLLCCIITLCGVSGCTSMGKSFSAGQFNCKKLDEKSIAIGQLNKNFSLDYIFVPQEIEGYTVKKLGFTTGLGFGGAGYLTINYDHELKRFYCPNSIEEVDSYMYLVANGLKVFYCGKLLELGQLGDSIEIYVPEEMYLDFYELMYEDRREILNRANVTYRLNYDTDNKYYYVDNYEYGSKIEYIPPIPTRNGYEFNGWYTEAECINKWDFHQSKLVSLRDGQEFLETKLYAKWVKL